MYPVFQCPRVFSNPAAIKHPADHASAAGPPVIRDLVLGRFVMKKFRTSFAPDGIAYPMEG